MREPILFCVNTSGRASGSHDQLQPADKESKNDSDGIAALSNFSASQRQSPLVNFDLLCPGSKPMQKPKEASVHSVHLWFVKMMKIDDKEVTGHCKSDEEWGEYSSYIVIYAWQSTSVLSRPCSVREGMRLWIVSML